MICIVSLKKNFFSLILFVFTICLIIFSSSNFIAAKSALNTWSASVVPALFPFFVATELLVNTNIPHILGKTFNSFMKPIFNVSGEGSFAFVMGLISGYPIGTKIICNFYKKNILSKEECERLLSFTNNSGPLFIIGTVGIGMFGNKTLGYLLFITHILACLTVGFLFRFWKKNTYSKKNNIKNSNTQNSISIDNLGEILSNSIYNSINTIMNIGGFVLFFSVIISVLKNSNTINILALPLSPLFKFMHIPKTFIVPLISGLFEITNGISLISNIHIKAISTNIVLSAFLLGIGGLSILLQIYSIISKTDLSIKPYIAGKILQGFIASIYTFAFIQLFPLFNFNL